MFAADSTLSESASSPERPLADVDFVAFDTETTGLWWGDRMIELGAVRFRNGKVTDRFRSFVQPHRAVPEGVTRIHGITDATVAEAPRARAVLARFNDFAAGAVLLAHYASFDQGIMATEYVRAGLSPPDAAVYCTLNLSRRVIPEAPRHGLASLAKHLSLPVTVAHRALPDADTARMIFQSCLARLGTDVTLGTLDTLAGEDGHALSLRGVVCALDGLPHRLRCLRPALKRGRSVRVTLAGDGGRVTTRLIPTAIYARGTEAWVDFRDPASTTHHETSVPLAKVVSVRA